MAKPILCLDFDGVIHSYSSGWKGARNIPDRPVPGALDFLITAVGTFEVAILSSRSHQWGGRRAMKQWLGMHLAPLLGYRTAKFVVNKMIKWPLSKPPALVTIDDRALTFNGDWSSYSVFELANFKPWNKK